MNKRGILKFISSLMCFALFYSMTVFAEENANMYNNAYQHEYVDDRICR